MPEGFEVTVEALNAHESSLGEVSDMLGEAGRSAEETLPSDAFGVLGEAIPGVLEQLAAKGREALRTAVQSADQLAGEISMTAQEYQSMDDEGAMTMDGTHE